MPCGKPMGLGALIANQLARMQGGFKNVCSYNVEGLDEEFVPLRWGMLVEASVSDGPNGYCGRRGSHEL